MPGAETWSAKEYKGYVYTGDMARGFDVFSLTSCDGAGCLVRPTNTPGRAKGGGGVAGEPAELSILSGPSKGGRATFSLDVTYVAGQAAPAGKLTFHDNAADRKVTATAIDSLTIAAAKASITGRATVDGVPGVSFFVEAEDVGKGADSFRIVLGDGYVAGGVLLKGKVEVTGGCWLRKPNRRGTHEEGIDRGARRGRARRLWRAPSRTRPSSAGLAAVPRRARRRAGRRGLHAHRHARSRVRGGDCSRRDGRQRPLAADRRARRRVERRRRFATALSSSALVQTVGKDKPFKGLPDGGPEQTADPLEAVAVGHGA